MPSQDGRLAIVTGANSGLGFHVALELGRKGAHVILACRDQITAASAVPSGAIVGYAVTSDGTALAGVSRRWGKLIDSDRTVGAFTGQAQPNFAVAFEMTVP